MACTIGIDFGTQSGRAVLVCTDTGEILAQAQAEYAHPLTESALVYGEDYDKALCELLTALCSHPRSGEIVGICVDATSPTVVPVAADGQLLSAHMDAEVHPMALVKLWKRHSAQRQADKALALAREMNEPFLSQTGETVSSEWMLPKVLETCEEDTEAFAKTDLTLDLCDYLTYRLTGRVTRAISSMSFKSQWLQGYGFPSADYLDALHPGFAARYPYLMRGDVLRPGEAAGELTDEWKQRLHLTQGVTVAAGQQDGFTPPVALGAVGDGDASLVLGTSTVLMLQSRTPCTVEGLCGVVRSGAVPELYSIEGGQNCTGDMLGWYMTNMLPESCAQEAREKGVSAHTLLSQRVVRPWENRLIAIDWWNGSRSAPCDLQLSGFLMGMTLSSRPEDIYLAMLQGMAVGTREIIEQCRRNGATFTAIRATGGVAKKNPLLMQQYADILGLPIAVADIEQGGAQGAAILAAVAAGVHPTVKAACAAMSAKQFVRYMPDEAHRKDYERRYHRAAKVRADMARLMHEMEN
ncbi:MAG: ribulokinase [Clostridia bacterium]|nr:ribulokinase [Clostridia bacterium]